MDPQAQAELRVGRTLCNKWKLEKLLGTGGMAAVYVAVHKIGRREAIKILHPDVAQAADVRARFEQEAHAVNRFKHPGAVEIRDIDVTEDGAPFLVMELLSGESLAEHAERLGGVAIPEVLRLVDELLDVLVAAHAQGIIHRDIKLDNLFVQKDGRLKVLDFGIARVRDGLPVQMRTRSGAMLGTAPYMPPEQIKGLDIDARADLFAVGATMFRLIARRRIHEASSETELLLKMASKPAPPLLSAAPGAPRDVGMVVDRALMFERDRRYPDAATMQGDVRAIRSGKPPPYAARFTDAPTLMGSEAMAAAPVSVVVRPAAPTRPEIEIGNRPPADAAPQGLPLGAEPTMQAPPADLPPLFIPPPSPVGVVGVGATALPAGATPGSRTIAVGPRSQIAGGIGTDLNLPTQAVGGGRAISAVPAAPPSLLKSPRVLLIAGGVLLVLGISGAIFWACGSLGSETAPSPAKSVDTSGRGHGPRPAVQPTSAKRPAKGP